MEKFAVDLDKVLDDFELDEDETESVNHYEKLQLEFCPDGGSTSHPPSSSTSSSAMRHNIGLGAFGGWSEPLQPQPAQVTSSTAPPTQPWCGSSLEDESPLHPPGTRSPPDGQNDDGQQSAACSQHLSSLSFHQSATIQPQTLHSENSGQRSQPPISQNSQSSSSALWPVIASPNVNSFCQPSVPEISSEHTRDGCKSDTVDSTIASLPTSPVDSVKPDRQEVRGAIGDCSFDLSETSSNSCIDKNVPVQGLDIITSRPLDVLPSDVHHEPLRMVSGQEGRHPDIIDVWQSGADSSATSPTREARSSIVPDNSDNAAMSPERLGENRDGMIDEPPTSNMEHSDHRLLPDLMSMNNCDVLPRNEGQIGSGGDYSEPAVVMENTLANSSSNDPAIVLESQSCSRIPEVVNIHQTAENINQREVNSFTVRNSSSDLQFPGQLSFAGHSGESGDRDSVGAVCNNSNSICDNSVRPAESSNPESRFADQQAPISVLPDVSDVNPVPVVFSKDNNLDDTDLDAELAELEEEQFRLQGAYGGSLTGSVSSIREGNNDTPRAHDSGMMGGPDLIDGVNAMYPHHKDSSPREAISVEGGADVQNIVRERTESTQSDVSLFENRENNESIECEVGGVEEVCQPKNSDITSSNGNSNVDTPEAVETAASSSQAGDGEDNLSNASTGTDTISSSSTLTDGEMGSPERRSQPLTTNDADSPSRVMPGTLVTAVYDDDSGSGREDEAVVGAEGVTESSTSVGSPSEGNIVGQVAPFWIPDDEAPNCQECGLKFTVIKRRHHCRACGRVLCAPCCHHKAPLPYMDYKEARVCGPCLQLIQLDQNYDRERGGNERHPKQGEQHQRRPPDPNNPMDYCSRVPPPQQAAAIAGAPPPTVMVPVGVLKREGNSSSSARNRGSKQVIFSDGIRPGGDLTELDGSGELLPPYRRTGRVARRVDRPLSGTNGEGNREVTGALLRSLPPDRCLIPPGAGLPPVVVQAPTTGEYMFESNPDSSKLEEQMRGDGPPVVFAVHKNLTVLVKVVKLECCVGVEVWNIATRGFCTVGQEEMVVLLEVAPGERVPPKDIFGFFHTIYQQANQGNLVTEMGHSIFTEPEGLLGSREHGGFLYIRPTFQCLRNLVLPPSPYIFAVLIQKWETPWAKVFPLRLMLRMGAEFRYYPCPLVSTRNRKPVFCEIGHTIMNLLVDFRNYAYTVPFIEGFFIHMEDKRTSLLFPKNRYEQVTKALNNSNDHVLALGANFSPQADSHLVTIENDDGHYSTQAINIHNKPRKVTGASFIVFNGALKTTSGLSAKSSIVEDGLMVQIPADMMTKLREALRNMKEFDIPCGPVSAEQPDEVVVIRWTSDDKNFNVGIQSAIDEKQMDGIPSVKIHTGTDYVSNAHMIRWTEVFILQGETNNSNDINLSRLSEILARAFCVALTPHIAEMYSNGYTRLALRSTIHQDSVGYEAGSNGSRLPAPCMNDLDTELIPVIHRAAANITDEPIVLELVFHIMEQ